MGLYRDLIGLRSKTPCQTLAFRYAFHWFPKSTLCKTCRRSEGSLPVPHNSSGLGHEDKDISRYALGGQIRFPKSIK
jgi:hypothetical protein